MLYATTRSNHDVFTTYKAIHTDCAPDGGLYLPFRLPQWEQDQILAMAQQSFGQNVAQVLNSFFSSGLTGFQVDFAAGRNSLRLASVNHRVVIAELWHTPSWNFRHTLQALSDLIRKEGAGEQPTGWVEIACSIAVIFAVYAEYLRADLQQIHTPVDIAVTTGGFTMPMAAWYARKMGLPIGNIICGCNANGGVWELLHLGELPTGALAVKTAAPQADFAVPRDLERLIHGTLGVEETLRYLQCCATGSLYEPGEELLETLRSGMFAAVISDSRIRSLIPSVYRTNQYIFGPYGALAYGSLMDYRAKTGETRPAILLSQQGALCDGDFVAGCMDISLPELQLKLTQGS